MVSKILFIEGNTDGTIGGSYFSLLYLVRNLNQNKYKPTVAFYSKHPLVSDFRKTGANVVIFKHLKL